MSNNQKDLKKKTQKTEPGVRYARPPKRPVIAEPEFGCCCCGTKYHDQKNNFYKTTSILYRGNNEYLPICRRCMDDLYLQYLATYGDPYEALRIIARQWDLYLNNTMYKRIAKGQLDKSRVADLIKYNSIAPHKGKNYLDVEREMADKEEDDESDSRVEFEVTPEIIDRWGTIYNKAEYELLEGHYHSFDDQKTEGDIVQEKLLLQLCQIYLMQVDCAKNKDGEQYSKLVKTYQDTLKSGNFKPVQKGSDVNDAEQCFGVFLKLCENFNPATLYLAPEYGVDRDGMGEYYDRFVKRPVENFVLGTNKQDDEYYISAGDESE